MANYFGIQWPDPPDDEQRPYTPVPIQQQQKAKAPAGVQGRFQPPVTPTVPTPPVYQQDRWESAPREVYPQDRWEAAPQAQPPMRDRWESAPTPPQRPYLPLVTQDGPRSEAMPPLVAAAPPVGGLPIVQAATRILPKLWEQRDEWAEAAKEIVQDYPQRVRQYWQSGQAVEDARQSPARFAGWNAPMNILTAPRQDPWTFLKETGQRGMAELQDPASLTARLLANPFVDFTKLPGPADARPANFAGEVQETLRQGQQAPLNALFYPAMRAYETTGEGPAAVESNAREQAKRETNFYDMMARANEVQTRLRDNITRMSPAEIARDREYIVQLQNAANAQVLRREQELLYERGQQQGILPALRATEAEKRQYRTNAPMGEQFLAGFFLDPLNAFDALGPVRDAYRVRLGEKALDPFMPTIKTAGGVIRPASGAEAKAGREAVLGRYNEVNKRLGPLVAFNPWRHTQQTMGEQLVNRTINATNRMLDGLPKTADGGIDLNLLQKAVADPHAPDIVQATAGYSQSAEWLDTAVVIDRALGVTPEATDAVATAQRAKIQQVEEQITATQKAIAETTAQLDNLKAQGKPAQQVNRTTNRLTKQQNSLANQQKHLDNLKAQVQQPGRVDFAGLIKLAQQPDSDSLTIAAELARQYADAAESFFPTTGKGLGRKLVNARDRFNNSILSTALLGTNPGYAFRNAANNLVTALVDGVNPYQSAEDLRALWVRWGAPPVQTKQGIGPGDAFKNRATTAEYLQNLATPLRMRDTFKLNGRKWRDYTRAVAANWEAYASERIVAHHIQTYFPQTWGGYLKELRKQIVQAGQLDETQATQITRLWASKLNRTELHEAIDAMTGPSRPRVTPPTAPTTPPAAPPAPGAAPTPPTAPSAPGWGTRPGAKKPYGTEPAPAPVLDLARTLSEDEAAQLVAEAGPGADTLARELLQAGPAAQRVFVDVLVPAQERSAQLAAHVNTLAGQTYTPGQRASLQQFLEDVQGVIETAKDNDDAMRQGVFEAAQNVTEAERTLIFREWRRARDAARRELYRRLDALEEARMPELGFDEQAVTNSRTHRQFIADAWARSDRVIENYWTGKGKGIAQDFEAVNRERRRIWTDVQNRIKLRAEQWDADLDRAVAKSKGSAVTAAPEPQTPEAPAPVGAELAAPAPQQAAQPAVQPDANQISRISAKARELGIPSASDRNAGTGAQGAMWDQHALNIARQRFPGEIRPDSKAFRSLQKATPDELNLVEQALDERLAERAAPSVDAPPAAVPEVAPAQQPITPAAPAVTAGPQTVAPAPQTWDARLEARRVAEAKSPRALFGDDLGGEKARAAGWKFWSDERGYNGNRPQYHAESPDGTQYVFDNNMRHGGADPWRPTYIPGVDDTGWRATPPNAAVPEVPPTAAPAIPDPRRPWETPAIRIERERRGTRLPVPGQPSTRVPFGKEPSAPAVAPSPRAAYAPPAVTREAEFMGPYAPPAIVGDYEARALPPSVFETWDDLVLGSDRAPYAPPAMTERPLQPDDWQRYGIPERLSVTPTPPPSTPTTTTQRLTRQDVAQILGAQYGNQGADIARLTDRWIDSDSFELMDVPITSVAPSVSVEAGAKSYSTGPIIVDFNKSEAGRFQGRYGAPPNVVIIDGKHRWQAAVERGDATIQAYVGTKAKKYIERVVEEVEGHNAQVRTAVTGFLTKEFPGRDFDALKRLLPEDEFNAIRAARKDKQPVPESIARKYGLAQPTPPSVAAPSAPNPRAIRERMAQLEGSLASGESRLRTKRDALGGKLSDADLADVQRSVESERRKIAELQAQLDALEGKTVQAAPGKQPWEMTLEGFVRGRTGRWEDLTPAQLDSYKRMYWESVHKAAVNGETLDPAVLDSLTPQQREYLAQRTDAVPHGYVSPEDRALNEQQVAQEQRFKQEAETARTYEQQQAAQRQAYERTRQYSESGVQKMVHDRVAEIERLQREIAAATANPALLEEQAERRARVAGKYTSPQDLLVEKQDALAGYTDSLRQLGNERPEWRDEIGKQLRTLKNSGQPVPPQVLADYPDLQPAARGAGWMGANTVTAAMRDAFLADKPIMQRNKAKKILDTRINYGDDGGVMTRREFIERAYQKGVQPPTATIEIQGKRKADLSGYHVSNEWIVDDVAVTKTEVDYLRHLWDEGQRVTPAPAAAPQLGVTPPTGAGAADVTQSAEYQQAYRAKLAADERNLRNTIENSRKTLAQANKEGHPRVAAQAQRTIEKAERDLEIIKTGRFPREDDADFLIRAELAEQARKAGKTVEPVRMAGIEPVAPASPATRQLTGPTGNTVTAYGTDPNRVYEFRYRVAELDDLIASQSDAMTPNPQYPAELQPRIRDRAASQAQVTNMAQNLQPDGLLGNFNSLDRGAMIVGPDAVVESGNGRVLALRQVRAAVPEKWQAYQVRLREVAPAYGIDPAQLDSLKAPVLVRERVTDVDRVRFTAEANEQATLAMSPVETALQDAGRVQDDLLATLQVGDNQSVDQALTSAQNWPIIKAFLAAIPANERAALATAEGALNAFGLARLKGALFAKTYPGDAGQRLAQTFIESLDPSLKNIEAGMFASLPRMSRAESLVRSGERAAELAFGDDLAAAVDVLSRLKEQGIRVDDYLSQMSMFDDELTPFQKEVLQYLDSIGRSPKKVRESLNAYADAVEAAPRPGQMGLLADPVGITKEDILGRIRETQANAPTEQAGLWGTERIGQANPPAFGAQGKGLEKPTFGQQRLGITAPGTQEAFAVMDAATAAARRVADFFTNRRVAAQPVNPLTPEQAAWLHQFADDFAAPKQMKAKAIASNIAVKLRNFALGDYADRRNIHEWLTWLYPYAYWYTFTYPNWARRIFQHPAILSNYARYKQVVREQNREYYRDMVGDPNAEPPEYWNYQLRIPFGDTQLYFNLERNLNPLVQLVESFKQTAKSAAPAFPWNAQAPEGERGFFQSGDFIQALGDFGPSLSPPLIYAYALWLASQGYTEAAQQWVGGYLTPASRLMRPVTAALREAVPATGAVIPPGGWSPEMLILDFMQRGGDYWQQRSGIPAALVDLYRTDKATATEVENAAWSRDVWDSKWGDAAQANALKTLAPVFASWLLGQGFKPTDITDVQIQQMWDDKAALTAQKGTLSKEDYNVAWEAFKEKYPWFNVFMLARSQDPVERLDAFTDLVLDRLPPAGPQRQQMLTAAGMPPELMDRYYSDKYSTANFTPEERAQFELAIEKLAGTVDVPDAATQATYDAARSENQAINAAAAQAAGLTTEQVRAHQDAYFADDDKARRKAYLAANPAFAKYLNERSIRQAQGSETYQDFYYDQTKPTNRGLTEAIQQYGEARVREAQAYLDMTPEQRRAYRTANPQGYARVAPVLDALFKYSETTGTTGTGAAGGTSSAQYAQTRARIAKELGQQTLTDIDNWRNLSVEQKAAFKQQQPARYAKMQQAWDLLYPDSTYSRSSYTPRTYSGGSSYSGGGRSYGGRSYGSAPAPVSPVTVTPQQPAAPEWQNWTEQDFNARWQPLVDADPALPQLVSVLFGKDMLNVLRLWLKLTPEQRALWLQANPQLWAMLQRFMRWFMAQQVGKTGAGILLGSIPPNAPIPSATTVPPNAPYVPTPPAVPSAPAGANAGIPLPP